MGSAMSAVALEDATQGVPSGTICVELGQPAVLAARTTHSARPWRGVLAHRDPCESRTRDMRTRYSNRAAVNFIALRRHAVATRASAQDGSARERRQNAWNI